MLKQIFLVTAITLLASAAYAQNAFHGTAPQAQLPVQQAPNFVFTEAPDDYVVGGNFAPITVITYASVTCPHCGNWFTKEWPKVKAKLVESGKIRFVLREYPTAPAALSMTGFALAACAPRERYMSVIEYQMENQTKILKQSQQGKGREAYDKIARVAGLNNDADISACLSSPYPTQHINLSQSRAAAAGVQSVPAFFINGQPYKGDQSAKAMISLVDSMLGIGVSSHR